MQPHIIELGGQQVNLRNIARRQMHAPPSSVLPKFCRLHMKDGSPAVDISHAEHSDLHHALAQLAIADMEAEADPAIRERGVSLPPITLY